MSTSAGTHIDPGTGGRHEPVHPEITFGCGGGWIWCGATITGIHHQRRGGECEDAIKVRLLGTAGGAAQSAIHVALADGVSGGARGAVAARAGVKHCVSWDPAGCHSLRDWIKDRADLSVQAALREHTHKPGACTIAAAWIDAAGKATVNRIGDSRAYAWQQSPNALIALSPCLPDQTMAYMRYSTHDSDNAKQPAHMVGINNTGEPEFAKVQLYPRGGLLLCSDGLHTVIPPADLARYLLEFASLAANGSVQALGEWSALLVQRAQQLGSEDDVSVLVVSRISDDQRK